MKLGRVIFEIRERTDKETNRQTNKHTYRQADHNTWHRTGVEVERLGSLYFVPCCMARVGFRVRRTTDQAVKGFVTPFEIGLWQGSMTSYTGGGHFPRRRQMRR